MDNSDFFCLIYPKMDLDFEIQKINVGIRISMLKIPCVPISRQNMQLWLFVGQIYPKMDLMLEIEKTNAWIRITILETTCVPIFGQNRQIWLSRSKVAQKQILGLEFQKSKSGFEISKSKWMTLNFSGWIWGNCPITWDILVLRHWRSCRELGGGGWVKLGAEFSNTWFTTAFCSDITDLHLKSLSYLLSLPWSEESCSFDWSSTDTFLLKITWHILDLAGQTIF